ncbi:sugar porter family MFS transporter [Salinisphaera sp. Q1T1-3]|uniref:sugar porter family MFS transporter n=1 Tax=Salinisphaera sp. Q1T1-3 TaxID=2321229 RepID=UPI000E7610E9|nr:sugar porter family MFS transporter [Salinisphaera sp. Q1T1-3]RJS92399.1 sugar porter family MFS transporter [Salinisphaera sp. Q1T1-3]
MSTSQTVAPERTPAARGTIWTIGFVAALAGLLFGMDIGVISGALPLIKDAFAISDFMQEMIVSAMMLGAAIGAAGSGTISRRYGRRRTLLISGLVFALGAIACALSWSPGALVGARILLGIAVGMSSYIAPIYLSEIAPEYIRGRLISFYQLMIMGGILAAYLVNAVFVDLGGWRLMLGVIALPALAMVIGMAALPRSPRWLMDSGHEHEARQVLAQLRGDDARRIDAEIDLIRKSANLSEAGWSLFKRNRNFRRSTGLGMLLQFMQQFTGANVILYYAPHILELAGYASAREQLWGTVLIGLLMTLATFIAIGFVDRLGRKPLLYTGFSVMGICMVLLGTLYEYGLDSASAQYVAIGLLCLFVISYAMSAAPMVWILCSEIQPLKGRDFGVTCSTVTNWVSNMVIGATFLTLLNVAGNAGTFGLYAALNFLFIVFTLLLIPETKGISLERIEENLMAGKPLRRIGIN